jgi:hypothetical protein
MQRRVPNGKNLGLECAQCKGWVVGGGWVALLQHGGIAPLHTLLSTNTYIQIRVALLMAQHIHISNLHTVKCTYSTLGQYF